MAECTHCHIDQSGEADNPYRYSGYQYDEGTGLYYLNSRMYDPVTARFMQEDTYTGNTSDPLSLNRYTYCHNDPIRYWDPTGHIVTQWDRDNLTDEQIDLIQHYTNEWVTKNTNNDEDGKTLAHAEAERIRNSVRNDNEIESTCKDGYTYIKESSTSSIATIYQGDEKDTTKKSKKKYKPKKEIVVEPVVEKVTDEVNEDSKENNENKYGDVGLSNDSNETGDSPIVLEGTGNSIDLSKLKPEDVTREIDEWLIVNPINVFVTQYPYITAALTGVNVLALFYAAGVVMDGDGVYHARQEWSLQSFEYSGYNDFYDIVFHYATDMDKAKFEFVSGGKDYILWAWKGDYLNLGAGAEMGIYKRMGDTEHWLVDQSLAMPMTLTLDYNGKQIISYDLKKVDPKIFDPLRKSTDKWWVTGFNTYYQDKKASELTATYTATFNTQAMYDDFYNKYGNKNSIYWDPRWTFDPKTITGTLKF